MQIHNEISSHQNKFISLEFFPPKEKNGISDFLQKIDKFAEINPLFVSITYGAGGTTSQNTLTLASALSSDYKLNVMPHLTCIGATEEIISDFLNQCKKSNIANILALRGDLPLSSTCNNSKFPYAQDLVTFIRNYDSYFGISVAGYPTLHPDSISTQQDLEFTSQKVLAGANFIITQLFFDNRIFFDYVNRLRGLGVTVPIIPGILPLLSLHSARRILSIGKLSIPGDLYLKIEAAHEENGDEGVRKIGIEFSVNQIVNLLKNGCPGIHLYTLNNANISKEIWDKVQEQL